MMKFVRRRLIPGELRRRRSLTILTRLALALIILAGVPTTERVGARELAAAEQETAGAQPQAAEKEAPHQEGTASEAAEEEHGGTIWELAAKIVNFALLAGILVYFLRTPLASYLTGRSTQIRSDLIKASEMRAAAAEELREIDRRLTALPGELEALKVQGAQEIAGEETRIREAAETERTRLLEQTRREIDLHLRIAKRELVAHTADLAIKLATDRVKRRIDDEDQNRLVDRYLGHVGTGPNA